MSIVRIIESDNSTIEKKIDTIEKLGYFDKSRWTNGSAIFKLDFDVKQVNLLAKDLVYISRGFDDKFNKHVIGEYYEITKDFDKKNILYSMVFLVPDRNSMLEKYSKETEKKEYESSACGYVLNTVKRKSLLNFYPCFRYDTTQLNSHENDFETLKKYLSDNEYELYTQIFPKTIDRDMPHFHFTDEQFLIHKHKSTDSSNAIDIESLKQYIRLLQKVEDKSNLINQIDFGMPFLAIKNNPSLYTTNPEVLGMEFNFRAQKISRSLIGSLINKKNNTLTGLEAVLYDLTILSGFNKSNKKTGNTFDLIKELLLARKIATTVSEINKTLNYIKGNDKGIDP